MRIAELLAAILQGTAPVVCDKPFARLDECGQGRLGIGRNGKVDFRVPLEVLIVPLGGQIEGGDADQFRPGPDDGSRRPNDGVAHRVDGAPEVGQFETEDDICVRHELSGAVTVIERMP